MISHLLAYAPVALLPVLIFLAALVYFDSFKLVSLRSVMLAVAVGGLAAGASYVLNGMLLDALGLDFVTYSRYVSPWLEETLKAVAV